MERLKTLYTQTFSENPTQIEAIKDSGSARRYFRLSSNNHSAIGVIGTSIEENNAFIGLTKHFLSRNLPVPSIYNVYPDHMAYLQSDLGHDSLYSLLTEGRNSQNYTNQDIQLIEKCIRLLPHMQIEGAKGLDTSLCYPTSKMDATSIHFDLNYFKYCFLKLIPNVEFNEISLENDFNTLCDDILKISEGKHSLILRDCQARNIMVKKSETEASPYFIDYQGCRLGPVEYDLASFLWQSSAHYPQELRNKLITCYIDSLQKISTEYSEKEVRDNLKLMVLFRLIQVLGAYGFRGYIEHKQYFVDSIPYAIANLREVIDNNTTRPYPYLEKVLKQVVLHTPTQSTPTTSKDNTQQLTVTIYSFSFKKGIPHDPSGNGGGYVFDCRSTHNPGKYQQYKKMTGLDSPVIKFLEDDGEILTFLNHVYPIVEHHVERFIERRFCSLFVCFGCTGGQHRSVYSAQHVAERLHALYPNINIHLIHREQKIDTYL